MSSLTYPGVYVREDLSGPRPIQGIQPSNTAFIGRTLKGPVGVGVAVHNFSEFAAAFGGFWSKTWLPEAVRDFFLNGGGTAIVIRAVHSVGDPRAVEAKRGEAMVLANATHIRLIAKDLGKFSEAWQAVVESGGIGANGVPDPGLYALSITTKPAADGSIVVLERLANLKPANMIAAINARSALVTAETGAGGTSTAAFTQASDGGDLVQSDFTDETATTIEARGALTVLDSVDLFSLLVIPPPRQTFTDNAWKAVVAAATKTAVKRRAFLILDAPATWSEPTTQPSAMSVGFFGPPSPNAAIYTPWVDQSDDDGNLFRVPPSGAIAGIYARTDGESGVWKAPAGVDSGVFGAAGPSRILTREQNGDLNIRGINCLMRKTNRPIVSWGARTTEGFDGSGSLFRYVSVRRLFLFVEETLFRNTEWVVFRENDETLWFQVKASIEAFLHGLFLKGAFQGDIPEQAYYVECGWSTMTQADIDNGILNITVGIAPVKPAEFVVITFRHIQQTA